VNRWLGWILSTALLAGCALGDDGRNGDAGRTLDAGRADAGREDAGRSDAGRSDAGRSDAGRGDAGNDAGRGDDAGPRTDAGGGGLDPGLDPAGSGGDPCDTPGSFGDCPNSEVCRFFSSSEGRCEGCSECGGLGASCTSGVDCDTAFVCYEGRCSGFCLLDTLDCGEACIDVGYPTFGVCPP
jgi:hypothetical protein